MNIRKTGFRLVIIALSLTALMLMLQSTFALSAVCAGIDGTSANDAPAAIPGVVTIEAGETLSATLSDPKGGASLVAFIVDSVAVQIGAIPGTVSYTFTTTGSYDILWDLNAGTADFSFSCTAAGGGAGGAAGEPGPLATNLLDGRLNNDQGKDVAAPVAIYPGSIQVYGIDPDSGAGHLVLHLSDEQVEAAGIPTDANLLLAEGVIAATGMPVRLYRLTTGEYAVITQYANGTPYNYVWDDNGNGYHVP